MDSDEESDTDEETKELLMKLSEIHEKVCFTSSNGKENEIVNGIKEARIEILDF